MFEDAPPSAGEVRALAHQLMQWANRLTAQPEESRELTEEARHGLILGLALVTREGRRLRNGIFLGAPLGNPHWDVMLDLFIQEMNGFRTSLDHLALTGDLPALAIYDSVDTLVRQGLIERTADRFDNRVFWLALSQTGRQGMFDLMEQSAEFVRPIAGRIPEREKVEA